VPIIGTIASAFRILTKYYLSIGTNSTSPVITTYPWTSSGYGAKYADPATLPNGFGLKVKFNASSTNIAAAGGTSATSPYVFVYPWSDAGYGTKYADAASPPGSATSVGWNPAGTAFAVGISATPYVNAWIWSAGFSTKYSNPATALPGLAPLGMNWSPDGTYFGITYPSGSPTASVYSWTAGSGFGTKVANPATAAGVNGQDVRWSPAGTDIIITTNTTSPWVNAYPWSAGFGSKYAAPAVTPPGAPIGNFGWHPTGTVVAFPANATTSSVYAWSAGFGTKYADPATAITTGSSRGGANFSLSGTEIAYGLTATPYTAAYAWSSGFGTKYSNPATLPAGVGNSISMG